jgi:hypothetical protein
MPLGMLKEGGTIWRPLAMVSIKDSFTFHKLPLLVTGADEDIDTKIHCIHSMAVYLSS